LGQSKPYYPGNRNEVLAMSPTRARKFTDVARRHPAANPVEPALVGDGATGESALDTASQTLRKAGPAREGPSSHLDPLPYDDPCNYLG